MEREKNSFFREQSEQSMKNSAGFSSLSIVIEEQDEYLVKVTTSVLTLSHERVGSSGVDIDLTT